MPLFNKKPIEPTPAIPPSLVYSHPETEVWFIDFTGEIFLNYDEFITRYTLYKKRVWTCEVTGKAGLTYREAMESEKAARRKYDSKFPEAWRRVALEKIHWSTQPLVNLVDELHAYLSERVFIGELVGVMLGGEEYNAVVTEIYPLPKPGQQDVDVKKPLYTMLNPPTETPKVEEQSKYLVHLSTADGRMLDDMDPETSVRFKFYGFQLQRNKRAMAKTNLKVFIKDSATRETWVGAPWVVKSDLVRRYHLSVTPPESLNVKSSDKQKKLMESRKKIIEEVNPKIEVIQFPIEDLDLPSKAPRAKVDANGVAIPEKPTPSDNLLGITCESLSPLLQSWYFLTVFGKAIGFYPSNLDDFAQALCHRSDRPRALLVYEAFGTLMTAACKYWAEALHAGHVRPELPSTSPDDGKDQYFSKLRELSDDEKVSIEQWYKWCPGRWCTEAEVKGRSRHQDHSKRLKAWEVALIGFLRDAVPDVAFPGKWRVLSLLVGNEPADDFITKAETAPPEVKPEQPNYAELANGDLDILTQLGMDDSDAEVTQRRSLRKRKRVIAYSSEEEEEEKPAAKAVRSSSRLKAAAAAEKPPSDHEPEEEAEEKAPAAKSRGRPPKNKLQNVDIEKLIEIASRRFALLDATDKVSILHCIVQFGALHSETIRDYVDDAVDKVLELRKERREMSKDQKTVEQLKAELEQKEKEKVAVKENGVNGHHEDEKGAEAEHAHETPTYDVDALSRISSRVMKLKAEQARREEEERRRREEAEKARREHKEKQKELRKAQEEKKKVDESERALLKRQITIEVELRMMVGVSRVTPLGCDRYFNRYWWFDGSVGTMTPEIEALQHLTKKGGLKIGQLEWATGVLFVEDVGFRAEDRPKFLETQGSDVQGRWGYYSNPEQVEDLMRWLDPRGLREMELLSALSHVKEAALMSMKKRLEDHEKQVETSALRRSSRHGVDDSAASFMKYTNHWASYELYKKGTLLQGSTQ
ncbi:hypothetical protein HDU96_009179 [Phlyctochytrium bullatum]|nr:hypothetical protein HDU96_009179 [Phlyctochytrium bullatum]